MTNDDEHPNPETDDEIQILDVDVDVDRESDTERALAEEAEALEVATRQPPIAPLLIKLDVEIDDLAVAELAATGGPIYDLNEFEDVDEVGRLLDLLDTMNVRWALDRSAQLVVHYNDEAAVDDMIERVFDDPFADDAEHESEHDSGTAHEAGPNQQSDLAGSDAATGAGVDFADGNITIDVSEPSIPSTGNGAATRYGIADVDGRPAGDDLTADASPVVVSRGIAWVAPVVVLVILVMLFIVFLV